MQTRLKRFVRQPARLSSRQLTEKAVAALANIERYRFLPSSLLVRLMPGGLRNNYRQLQTLFHKGLASRFALPTVYGTPGEFVYYLDSREAIKLLIDRGMIALTDDARKALDIVRLNREKAYDQLHKDPDVQGKLLYMQHELMISRFHAMLELACRKLAGKVELEQWKQGPELWRRVQCPKVRKNGETWTESSEADQLPHRPDAFFTLHFPSSGKRSHFLYEADRGTENTTRFKLKLRAHWQFIVKQNLQRTAPYDVHSIRAVLIESTNSNWASVLRDSARHPVVSPNPSPLFWFTTSELFFSKPEGPGQPVKPLYTEQPEIVFKRIWASPAADKLLNLAD